MGSILRSTSLSMHKKILPFHYLTQDMHERTHADQVKTACAAGVTWIQLRVKSRSDKEWQGIAEEVKSITDSFKCILIINDNPVIAKAVNADGVHLGMNDMNWKEARIMLGDEKIIGLSTHSYEEILAAENFGVDYFGLGPIHFTPTKEKLDPVIGIEGIKKIVGQARKSGIKQPIVAIGGIQLEDVREIIEAGADGIAVSSAVNKNVKADEAIKNFLALLGEQRGLASTYSKA